MPDPGRLILKTIPLLFCVRARVCVCVCVQYTIIATCESLEFSLIEKISEKYYMVILFSGRF